MGIDYFCIETDIKDDDKVFALRYHYATEGGGYDHAAGYAAFGRLVDVLADIYREGFAAEMNPPRRIRLSQQLGLPPEEFDRFIGECVNAGLFDRRLWEEHQVLTSRGIQRRYYIVASRRTGAIPDSQRRWLLPDDDGPEDDPDGPGADHAAPSEVERDKMQHDAESCPLREEKERKEKRSKEKKREEKGEPDKVRAAAIAAMTANLSRNLSTPIDGRAKKHLQPYPLSCMSLCGGDDRYEDGMGIAYDTPWDAIVQHLRQRAPDCDVGSFSQRVAATCPVGCCESHECVNECFDLISKALGKFNRSKCASPIPIVCKVLADERKGAAA